MLPRAINSTTAADLARATIVELAVNVYENALATTENAQFALDELGRYLADVTRADALVAEAISAATTAQEDARRAESAKNRAVAAESLSLQNMNICREERTAADAAADRAAASVDGKLDRVADTAGRARVYAVSKAGTNFMKTIADETDPSERSLAQYSVGGTLYVATPTDDNHAATKAYVDAAIERAIAP